MLTHPGADLRRTVTGAGSPPQLARIGVFRRHGKEGVDGSSPSEGSSSRPRLTSGILCRAPLAESPALTEEDDSLRVLLVSILLVQLTGPGILLVVSAAFSRERRPRCLLGRLRLSV